MADADLTAVVALLQQINAKLDRLLARERTAAPLSREDRAFLARLLPVVAGIYGSEDFHAAELCESENPALRLVCTGWSARRLGRVFRRSVDIPIDGYVVTRAGAVAGAVCWRVEKVFVPHGPSADVA